MLLLFLALNVCMWEVSLLCVLPWILLQTHSPALCLLTRLMQSSGAFKSWYPMLCYLDWPNKCIGLMWFLFLFFSILANTICLCVTVKETDIAVENWDPKLEQEKNRTLFSKRTYSPNASKSYSVIFTWHTTRFIFANIKTAQFLVIPAFRPSGNLCASLKDGDRLC